MRAREKAIGDLQLHVEHPEIRKVSQQRAGIEHADHELLAERDGDGRDAHFDLAIPARRLDAPVLRSPFLGDVEARQRLDARDDGRVNQFGQGMHVVEHAVDAHSHDGLLPPRLDVDVARALIERVVQQVLDRRNHVAVARLDLFDALEFDVAFEIADVDDRRGLLLRRVDRTAEPVEVGDEPLDFARRGDDQSRLAPNVGLERLDEVAVERVGHGDRDGAFVGGDDERRVAPCERAREQLRRELGVDLQGVQVDEGQSHVLRERLHHGPFTQRNTHVSRLA